MMAQDDYLNTGSQKEKVPSSFADAAVKRTARILDHIPPWRIGYGFSLQRFWSKCSSLHQDGARFYRVHGPASFRLQAANIPSYSDSLPGVRSVIEAMDNVGLVFNATIARINNTRLITSNVRNRLRESEIGTMGLKKTAMVRNAAIQKYLPLRAACTKTTVAPAQTRKAIKKVR